MTDFIGSRPGMGNDFWLSQSKGGWSVIDENHVKVSGPHRMRSVAQQARRDLQAAKNAKERRGPRPCITCSATFESEGVHHRMCTECRHNSEAFPGVASVYQRGARRVAKS